MEKIRVQLIDDSAVVRQVLRQELARDPAIEVTGAAQDPLFALEQMARSWPDVIVLDVEMPRMDGLTFLRKIMAERPTPVVICSTLTEAGSATALDALAAGAVSIVTKPKLGLKDFLQDAASDLIQSVKAAARANVRNVRGVAPRLGVDALLPPPRPGLAQTTDRVVAIGTSTGGTQALEVVLSALPRVCPGLVIVQHMPEKFTAAFAQRLDSVCEIRVKEAVSGDRVVPGLALIAPGGRHMLLHRSGAQYHVEVRDGPLVNRHRPSVDVLFRSVAHAAGANALGIIMTGMGDDGARGLKEMREAGARTLAQNEASCVVYGMPKEAVKRGAVERSVDLDRIASEIVLFGTQ